MSSLQAALYLRSRCRVKPTVFWRALFCAALLFPLRAAPGQTPPLKPAQAAAESTEAAPPTPPPAAQAHAASARPATAQTTASLPKAAPSPSTATAQSQATIQLHTEAELSANLTALETQRSAQWHSWIARGRALSRAAADANTPDLLDALIAELLTTLQEDLKRARSPSRLLTLPSLLMHSPSSARLSEAIARRAALAARETEGREALSILSARALRAALKLQGDLPARQAVYKTLSKGASRRRLRLDLRSTRLLIEQRLGLRLHQLRGLQAGLSASQSTLLFSSGARLVMVLLFFVFAARRRERLALWIRRSVSHQIKTPRLRLATDRWLRLSVSLLPALGGLLLVVSVFWSLSPLQLSELRLVRLLCILWACYRLLRAAGLNLLTTWAAARDDILAPPLRLRILQSLRLAGRTALLGAALLMVVNRLLGTGPIFILLRAGVLVAALICGLILIARWREEILKLASARFPDSGSKLWNRPPAPTNVDTSNESAPVPSPPRSKARDTLLALLLGVGLVLYAVGRLVGSLLLRVTQVRRAVSSLERRSLERRVGSDETSEAELARLPTPIHEAFAPGPVGPNEALPLFPRLKQTLAFLEERATLGAGASVALVGEPGSGRRSWLRALAQADNSVETRELIFETRLLEPAAMEAALNEGLELGCEGHPDTEAICHALESRPMQRIVVRNTKLLLLRSMGGLAAIKRFLEIVGRTADHQQWICVFPDGLWRFLGQTHPDRHLMNRVVSLGPWTEDQIGDLIDRRMRSAGVEVRYDAEVVEDVEGTSFDSELVHNARRYHRLIWDYADGNPAAALHFWLRSLHPTSCDGKEGVAVRLFRTPSVAKLEALDERSRFALAAVALHDALATSELAQILDLGAGDAESMLESLREEGFIEARGQHYKLCTHWQRAILRFLRQHHLEAA